MIVLVFQVLLPPFVIVVAKGLEARAVFAVAELVMAFLAVAFAATAAIAVEDAATAVIAV